ncbi:MAG: tetratricopeptide repeat protein [Candidatus Omnitrophota bacterium]
MRINKNNLARTNFILILALFFTALGAYKVCAQDLQTQIKELEQAVIKRKKTRKNITEPEKEIAVKAVEAEEFENEKEITEEKEVIEEKELAVEENVKQKDLKYYYNLALMYDQNEQYDEAEIEYQKALDINPNDPDTHYNLGILYDDHFQDKEQAIYHYQEYLKLMPGAKDKEKVQTWIRWAKQQLALSGFKQ